MDNLIHLSPPDRSLSKYSGTYKMLHMTPTILRNLCYLSAANDEKQTNADYNNQLQSRLIRFVLSSIV
jgi:hypothetical protein